jgi:GDPmannose 4,6-dehydratase
MPRAIVVGHNGQDGALLADQLRARGYDVTGIGRSGPISILDREQVAGLVRSLRPAHVYYLAAHHGSSEGARGDVFATLESAFRVHVMGLMQFLDAIARGSPATRLFYAASAHVFGDPATVPQNEATPFAPICTYGITKAAGAGLCRMYRRDHGVFCSVGILFNHESPRRAPSFASRKITRAVAAIKDGTSDSLVLGNLSAQVDWGDAEDYVDAMQRILNHSVADDFVVSSGDLHTLREFVEIAFATAGLDSSKYVREDPTLLRNATPRRQLFGDSAKLTAATGWRPRTPFVQLVHKMVKADLAASHSAGVTGTAQQTMVEHGR